jgi:hypothetical protein
MSSASSSKPVIHAWLERIGLGHFWPNFISHDITTPQALIALKQEQYAALGITDGPSAVSPNSIRV